MIYNLPVGAAVRYFMQLMGQPTPDTPNFDRILTKERWDLRMDLINEEKDELVEAYLDGDIAGVLDACVDLVYVTVGLAVEAGLPFDEAFAAVHLANMQKAPTCESCQGTGKVQHIPVGASTAPVLTCEKCAGRGRIVSFRDDGKVLKPVGWEAPNIASIIWKENDADPAPAIV